VRASEFARAGDVRADAAADDRTAGLTTEVIVQPRIVAIASGLVISLLAWIDPLFIPLVLAGPPISGAILASRGVPARWPALAWAVAGLGMLVSDWIVYREDVVFHAVLTMVMTVLAGGAAHAMHAHRRRRARADSRVAVARGDVAR
jgi:hypothetical protein